MSYIKTFLLLIAWGLTQDVVFCQPADSLGRNIPQGISLTSGYIHYGVKDNYISDEKYAGGTENFILDWSKFHDSYLFDLQFQILSGAEARNNTMSAAITDFSMSLAYQYPIGSIDLGRRRLQFYLGPYPELYFHFRTQNIARGGAAIIDAYSVAMLFSVGGRLSGFVSLCDNISLAGDVSTSVVSLGGKIIDPREKENRMVKMLTLLAGVRATTSIGANYHLTDTFSVGCGYRFTVVRISAWDSFLYASDNFTLTVTTTL